MNDYYIEIVGPNGMKIKVKSLLELDNNLIIPRLLPFLAQIHCSTVLKLCIYFIIQLYEKDGYDLEYKFISIFLQAIFLKLIFDTHQDNIFLPNMMDCYKILSQPDLETKKKLITIIRYLYFILGSVQPLDLEDKRDLEMQAKLLKEMIFASEGMNLKGMEKDKYWEEYKITFLEFLKLLKLIQLEKLRYFRIEVFKMLPKEDKELPIDRCDDNSKYSVELMERTERAWDNFPLLLELYSSLVSSHIQQMEEMIQNKIATKQLKREESN